MAQTYVKQPPKPALRRQLSHAQKLMAKAKRAESAERGLIEVFKLITMVPSDTPNYQLVLQELNKRLTPQQRRKALQNLPEVELNEAEQYAIGKMYRISGNHFAGRGIIKSFS